MTTSERLDRIARQIAQGDLPRAKQLWGGADVVIADHEPKKTEGGFYPEPRYVVTDSAFELSWLFESLRDIFYDASLIDSCSKIEFFGRLANAANRYLLREANKTADGLVSAVLHEGYAILDEIDEGTFACLPIAFGNEIADDYVDDALRSGFVGTEDTLSFFSSRGLELRHD